MVRLALTLVASAALCTTLPGCGGLRSMRSGAPVVAEGAAGQGAQLREVDIAVGGVSRRYLVLDGSDGTAPAPLVVALHGGGGNAGTMVDRWADKARAEGIILAFPNGVGRNARMATWNAGGCCAYAMENDSQDVAFVGAVIDDVAANHPVDPDRVYVTGMSNGGMLTHKVAIALGDRLAAAGVVAGAMFGDEGAAAAPVPILIMHGRQDEIVPFAGGKSPMALVARSQSKPFESVQWATNYWLRTNGCSGDPERSGTQEVQVLHYTQCRDGADVKLYSLASARHTWPGASEGSPLLERNRYETINATNVLWDFFREHRRQ